MEPRRLELPAEIVLALRVPPDIAVLWLSDLALRRRLVTGKRVLYTGPAGQGRILQPDTPAGEAGDW